MPHLVLASSSPSRRALLEQAGIVPLIDPADIDEDALLAQVAELHFAQQVAALAQAKAEHIAPKHPDAVIIGGDSMLLIDGTLQGKPYTVEEAARRWQAQRGKKAALLTGHCIIGPGGTTIVETSTTDIYFGTPTDADITAYAASEESLGCAGAFTLEAKGGWFIDRIDGDPSGVIGLSLPLVRRALYQLGYNVADFYNIGEPHTP